ncbi:hypothetical protein ACFW5X_27335 [Streptomyces albogriseolus]|uniref:hypothetical protein n=1 Tax=Streptomyces albogriseolus TaxID=1887 RepID=UPI0036B9E7B9
MAIRVDHVRSALADYLDQHPEAKTELRVILGLLEDSDGLTSRKTIPDAVPRNSRNARSTRWRSYALWCATYDWAEDEPNSVLSYLSDLGDRGHPANSIEAHFSTLRAMRAIQGTPLSDKEVKACQLVIRHGAGEEADDPLVEPCPLQADAVTLDELRLMVRTLDRTTVRGKRDAAVLLIAWWMAARASEPARLNLHDAKIRTVQIEDEDGRKRSHQALVIKIRRSKADQAARGQDVRILAPADQALCPIHALLRWSPRPVSLVARGHIALCSPEPSSVEGRGRELRSGLRHSGGPSSTERVETPWTYASMMTA